MRYLLDQPRRVNLYQIHGLDRASIPLQKSGQFKSQVLNNCNFYLVIVMNVTVWRIIFSLFLFCTLNHALQLITLMKK